MNNNLCVIPARGGSKRILKKNIKLFLGKPIIAYSIEIAQRSGLFDSVVVTTDSSEIASISESFGAEVPFLRTSENSSDTATLADAISEVLSYYNEEYSHVCCILPTAPLIQLEHLHRGLEILKNSNFETVSPVCEFACPIQRALELDGTGRISFKYENCRYVRTQDLKPYFHDAGQFYWMLSKVGLRTHNKGAFPISARFVQDIDNISDWMIAEAKYKYLNGE